MTNFLSLQTCMFVQIISIFWGFVPKFDNIIAEMKHNKMDETTLSRRWYFQTCLLFKTFILEIQDMLPLRQMAKIDL